MILGGCSSPLRGCNALCVHALPLHEFLVGTLLGNPAPLHHNDLVGVNNGLEPVRNHQHGFPMEQDIQRPLNEIFILCVGKGCSFVPISTTSANPHKTGTFQKSKDN